MDIPIDGVSLEKPVSLAAAIVPSRASPGSTVDLILRARTLIGWHIAAVGDRGAVGPILPTTFELRLPSGLAADGDWLCPEPEIDAEHGRIYRGDLIFRRKLKIAADLTPGPREIRCVVSYQVCDASSCRRGDPVELRSTMTVVPR
jgi:hypothetical protein